jgi:hypothetical protein
MFFTGNPPQPISQRVKTLEHGYLPVVRFANDVLTVNLSNHFRSAPAKIIHIPWFYGATSAEVDGNSVPLRSCRIGVTPNTQTMAAAKAAKHRSGVEL